MRPSDAELWRIAKRLVDRYGDSAETEAARRTDEFRAAGDEENAEVWDQVFAMTAELLRTDRENGESEH